MQITILRKYDVQLFPDADARVPGLVTPLDRTVKFAYAFANSYGLCKYQVASEEGVDVSGRRYACTSTEKSSWLRASASLRVKVSALGPLSSRRHRSRAERRR